jgi:hypothetical protein
MNRRNALDRLKESAQDPIHSIPTAQRRKRDNRAWDRAHRGMSYRIPSALHLRAKDIRSLILGLAYRHMTSASSVAAALMNYSLTHVRRGEFHIEARPNPRRRKMSLTWEEADGWPQEIEAKQRPAKKTGASLVLTYRWGKDVDQQIKALAGVEVCIGEVMVRLLDYALDSHRKGRFRLKEEAVVVSQRVSPTW